MGWTEYQKCPSIFFTLCRYIDNVYMYLYRYIIQNFHHHSYGFQNLCQVEGGGIPFLQLPYAREFWNIWLQKFVVFLFFVIELIRFFENLNNVFSLMQNWKKFCSKLVTFFIELISFFDSKECEERAWSVRSNASLKNLGFSHAKRTMRGRDAEKSCRARTAQRQCAKRPMCCL